MNIMNEIFKELEKNKINYCHFKSNQHLTESFEGKSDFDILVDPRDKKRCEEILLRFQCKQYEPVIIGAYPGVENWMAFDYNTGVLYHLHLHYQLISGKNLVKDYVFPWTDLALSTRVKDEKHDIFISNPNFEILLLLARTVVKSRTREHLAAAIGKYRLNEAMKAEYDYLRERIDEWSVISFAHKMFSKNSAGYIVDIVLHQKQLKSKQFRKLNELIRKELKNCRRYGAIHANVRSSVYRLIDLRNKFLSRKLGRLVITKKVNNAGGKIIAFIGVDGSGKSTISKEIQSWLGRKIECKKFYMGSGDGKKNIFATLVFALKKVVYKPGKKSVEKNRIDFESKEVKQIQFMKQPFNYIKKFINAFVIYSVIKDNRKKIIKMHKYRLNGGYSILDRFPQLEHESINDGLKLKKYAQILNSRMILRLARKEEEMMQIVHEIYPDIVFRLNISAETAMSRKPNEHFDIKPIEFKVKAVKSLKFEHSLLIEVDAEQAYDKELLIIKRKIWECI